MSSSADTNSQQDQVQANNQAEVTEQDLTPLASKVAHCPNCEAELIGPYCYQCGQEQRGLKQFFLALLGEYPLEVFDRNSRLTRTLKTLALKPGRISSDFIAAKRARYLSPIRVYLALSVVYFFILSIQNMMYDYEADKTLNIQFDSDQQSEAAPASEQGETGEDGSATTAVDSADGKEALELDFGDTDIPWLIELEKNLREKASIAQDLSQKDPGKLVSEALDIAPFVMFSLLPIFALLLSSLYVRRNFYYTEHLIVAVHLHSFICFMFIIDALLEPFESYEVIQILQTLVALWIPIYTFLSFKEVYQQSWLKTGVKLTLLGLSYSVIMVLAFLAAVVIGLLRL